MKVNFSGKMGIIIVFFSQICLSADTTVVDAMIVWSIEADKKANMIDISKGLITDINQAMKNSLIAVKINLVYAGKLNYSEGTTSSATSHQNFKFGQGALAEGYTLRDKWGADLCLLICANAGVIGTSNGWTSKYPVGNEKNAFATVCQQYLNYKTLVPHEWGHNLGCGHESGSGSAAFNYSHAIRFQTAQGERRTIMASSQNLKESILYYSNPDVLYEGVAIGKKDSANNALSIRMCAPIVAKYRNPPNSPVLVYNEMRSLIPNYKVEFVNKNIMQIAGVNKHSVVRIFSMDGKEVKSFTRNYSDNKLTLSLENFSSQKFIFKVSERASSKDSKIIMDQTIFPK